MQDVRKVHPPNKEVLKGLWLSFYPGAKIGVLGHNGSGKSTTIKTVLGLFPSMGGKVTFLGHDVSDAGSSANVKAGMALIPSERFVFPDLSVLDNLLRPQLGAGFCGGDAGVDAAGD